MMCYDHQLQKTVVCTIYAQSDTRFSWSGHPFWRRLCDYGKLFENTTNSIDDTSALAQVMVCCCQAPSHYGYLNSCWYKSTMLYGIQRLLLVSTVGAQFTEIMFKLMLTRIFKHGFWLAGSKTPAKQKPGFLTHWGRATHICVGKLTIIGSDNGLSPGRRQAIIWTSAGILLIGPLGTNFSEIWIGIQTFSFKKINLKMSFGKWRPFCLGLNVLMETAKDDIIYWVIAVFLLFQFSPDITSSVPHHKHYALEITENCSPTVDHCIIRSTSVGKYNRNLISQCSRKNFMFHQTFVRWALYILFKFVKSLIRHLGPAIGNVRHVQWYRKCCMSIIQIL